MNIESIFDKYNFHIVSGNDYWTILIQEELQYKIKIVKMEDIYFLYFYKDKKLIDNLQFTLQENSVKKIHDLIDT